MRQSIRTTYEKVSFTADTTYTNHENSLPNRNFYTFPSNLSSNSELTAQSTTPKAVALQNVLLMYLSASEVTHHNAKLSCLDCHHDGQVERIFAQNFYSIILGQEANTHSVVLIKGQLPVYRVSFS
jgi:hypothetical protein